jgi:protein gp37
MGEVTKIEWADSTLNFWIGCTQLKRRGGAPSACDKCYAMKLAKRFKIKWNAPPVRTKAASWSKPKAYHRGAGRFHEKHGRRRAVFVNSLSDFFDKLAPQAWRDEACAEMEAFDDVIYMLLTKRPENVPKMVPARWLEPGGWPDHIWLGITVEAQDTADHRVPLLLAIPARVRFLSMEPLFEDVALRSEWLELLSWIIIGGESGREARATSVKWVRRILVAAAAHGVPVLFKQWGEWVPAGQFTRGDVRTDGNYRVHRFDEQTPPNFRVGKEAAGRRVDGSLYDEFPPEAERLAA